MDSLSGGRSGVALFHACNVGAGRRGWRRRRRRRSSGMGRGSLTWVTALPTVQSQHISSGSFHENLFIVKQHNLGEDGRWVYFGSHDVVLPVVAM
jgi:hypothetical protein